jgi:WD40 repeat protein
MCVCPITVLYVLHTCKQTLAVGAADRNIYLYSTQTDKQQQQQTATTVASTAAGASSAATTTVTVIEYSRRALCRGHSGPVTAIDFSANSKYIRRCVTVNKRATYCLIALCMASVYSHECHAKVLANCSARSVQTYKLPLMYAYHVIGFVRMTCC